MFYGTTVENLKTTSQKTITNTKITQFAQFAQCNGTALKENQLSQKKQIRALKNKLQELKTFKKMLTY